MPAALAHGSYPLARPLYVISNGPPRGLARTLIDTLLSPRGQALVRKHGYLSPAARDRLWGAACVLFALVLALSLIALPARLAIHDEARHG